MSIPPGRATTRRSGSRAARWGCCACLVAALLARRAQAEPAPAEYHDYRSLTEQLDRDVARAGNLARKVSLGRTRGGRELWAVALGRDARRLVAPGPVSAEIHDDASTGSALLLAGGTDAAQIAGSEEALGILERMIAAYGHVDSVTQLLDRATLYVLPRVSPDACERFFQRPQAELSTNLTPTDDDHDGLLDEDAPDDLNGDGIISVMRVEDPEGDWLASPDDPRVLRRADRAKGEAGRYKVYPEGLDNDHDGRWNEDAAGGVDFNRNFPMGYKYFSDGAGTDPMTEVETRAVADFLFDHAGIAAVMVLGAQDNLLHPWKADPGSARAIQRALAALSRERGGDFGGSYGGNTSGSRLPGSGGAGGGGGGGGSDLDPRISSPPPEDAAIYDQLSERYRKLTGLKDSPDPPPAEGDLASYAYYNFGRWTVTARPWWPRMPEDSTASAHADSGSSRAPRPEGEAPREPRGRGGFDRGGAAAGRAPGGSADGDADAKVLKALEALKISAVIPWTAVSDPDFPRQKVEVGGFRPFVRTAPPASQLDSLSAQGALFVGDLLSRLPQVHLRLTQVTRLGPGLCRVEALVSNSGYLPLRSQMGRIARWPGSVFASLKLPAGTGFVSGHERARVTALGGSGAAMTVTWVVRGGGHATLRLEGAGCEPQVTEVSLP